MLHRLNIDVNDRLSSMSKGTKEKVQLIMVMSRDAQLYCLDEPIGGVDPAARDYILQTIITNYNENASVLISTHLISDIENVLDDVIFIQNGHIRLHASVDDIREQEGKSVVRIVPEGFMLGKLIKHEFKAVNRLMIPLHLALIVITVIGRFYIQLTLSARNEYFYSEAANVWYGVLDMTLVLFYIIALVAISIITSVYLTIIRFRKNLFTDEGYLMHTLPSIASQLIWEQDARRL